jgi:hypothetical protein
LAYRSSSREYRAVICAVSSCGFAGVADVVAVVAGTAAGEAWGVVFLGVVDVEDGLLMGATP